MKKLLGLVVLVMLCCNNAIAASIADELTKLNNLYKEGAITKEEFSKAKDMLFKSESVEDKSETTKFETKKEEKVVRDGRGRVRNYAKEYARKKELKANIKTKTNVDSQKILKQVSNASDSTKELSKEIKSMSKIFTENQKVLISMKTMIDALSTTLNQIQKQSRNTALVPMILKGQSFRMLFLTMMSLEDSLD